jgi:hypothetical protein
VWIRLHASDDRDVDLCVVWNVSSFAHGKRPCDMSQPLSASFFGPYSSNLPANCFPFSILQIHSSKWEILHQLP